LGKEYEAIEKQATDTNTEFDKALEKKDQAEADFEDVKSAWEVRVIEEKERRKEKAMAVLEGLEHWQEGIIGEMEWLKKELEKEDITPEKKTEFEQRMTALTTDLNGPNGTELKNARDFVEDMMNEEADRVEAEERKMMMETRDEANRMMIHEFEIADAAAWSAEDKLNQHNDKIQYEIDIIKELNLPDGADLD